MHNETYPTAEPARLSDYAGSPMSSSPPTKRFNPLENCAARTNITFNLIDQLHDMLDKIVGEGPRTINPPPPEDPKSLSAGMVDELNDRLGRVNLQLEGAVARLSRIAS